MAKTIADLIVESLKNAGVERVYGLPGDSLNGFTDSLRRDGTIEWIHVRNEEVAAFAAGADAHLTGSLAVCAASCGPGNLHLINGLFDCHRNRVPVLAIAAHIPSPEIGTNYFQETHPQNLFKECSHYCEMVGIPEQMPRVLEIALRTAINLSGVSVIVLPGDVLLHSAPSDHNLVPIRSAKPVIRPNDDELRDATEILNSAAKVTILGGAGCNGAHKELIATADALKAPIVHALRGKEYIEYDNPFDVGMTGLLGFSSGYHAMEDCDVLLMLGTDFPYPQFFPSHAKIIQVDLRGNQIGRRTKVDLGLVGSIKDTLSALLPLLTKKTDRAHLDTRTKDYKKVREGLDELAGPDDNKTPIHPQYVARLIDQLAAADAIFTCDVGTPTVWSARYLTMNGRRRLLGSFNHGSMASAVPQAIGAQSAFPTRQVVTLSGDGGLAMMLGDLLTLRQLKLPIKMVVFNNGALAFVELEMKAGGIVNYATDLDNPSFADLANSIGIHGVRVDQPNNLESAMKTAFATPGPALIEVMVNRQELSMPPHISLDQMKGFSLYMARSVFSGRGDEIIDLAKTNILQRILP
ncbi:ubiquinone-dependent pyruvate dehydrogenase [Tunturibacter empetritectus]|uniref:Pyruvate dehydrogenase [ubiquinone] n=2 Tax=Tunturiibacter empetritectus TaxID=3069691 RepID=A0A7W8MS53_9BACT|nr:ubiquinone-dependent pyruvate dehydrogenase [Edaphobacter lichenicola]MBB5317530.1 pyruvate dehydrogenase (quinone) [Edaphobacter lichenicola]